MKVKIEPLGFNHLQKYCGREPTCVKGAGKHNAKERKESRKNPAKCINCKAHHPANYWGCEVPKEL